MEELQKISRTSVWLRAFRLHTLPLAVACIALGNFLIFSNYGSDARTVHRFHPLIAVLSLLTAIFLQVLSNLSNDYGDARNGADNPDRKGPKRMVQSGMISLEQMKSGIIVFIFLSLLSGILLLVLSIEYIGIKGAMILFVLGLLSIAAAIGYTASRKPYGYRGLGDISVFIFFGLTGVYGSFFLQTGVLSSSILIPSIAMGLACTAVLNINNIRDMEADEQAGKMTIPVKIGLNHAKTYHWLLLMLPIVLFALYMIPQVTNSWQFAFLAPSILFVINGIGVSKSHKPEDINPYLKELVISILAFTASYGCSFLIFN